MTVNKMTDSHILSLDTQAILLLCGIFGSARAEDPKPLNLSEYNKVAQWLRDLEMRPSDLLNEEGTRRIRHCQTAPLAIDRVLALMARGASMAFAVESWTNKGLWVLSRVDDEYPQRLRDRLMRSAPPILYGSGRKELLSQGGLAIVGSRHVDEEALRFTHLLAECCAAQRIVVISGGARGVDGEAMGAALKKGGTVVGVLAKGLAQEASSKKFRDAIMAGTLVLLSPFHPYAVFNIGNAMGRNKYIYTLSDWALVISSGLGEGGTWAGATENLKHKWVPLFVRSGQVPEGNTRLVESGGIQLPETVLQEGLDLKSWLEDQSVVSHMAEPQGSEADLLTDRPIPKCAASSTLPDQVEKEPVTAGETGAKPSDHFDVIWPNIESELRTAKTSKELAEFFGVSQSQMASWLNHATEIGKARKLKKPVRYVVPSEDAENVGRQLTLPFKKLSKGKDTGREKT